MVQGPGGDPDIGSVSEARINFLMPSLIFFLIHYAFLSNRWGCSKLPYTFTIIDWITAAFFLNTFPVSLNDQNS